MVYTMPLFLVAALRDFLCALKSSLSFSKWYPWHIRTLVLRGVDGKARRSHKVFLFGGDLVDCFPFHFVLFLTSIMQFMNVTDVFLITRSTLHGLIQDRQVSSDERNGMPEAISCALDRDAHIDSQLGGQPT